MTKNNEIFIFNTSGSSGQPKSVKKSRQSLLAEAQDLADFFKFSQDTVFVSTVSTEFMYGTTFVAMLPQVLGCKVDEERVFYPEDIKDYEKFVFVSTPSFLEKLAKYNYIFKHKPEMIISAGAKLDDEIFEYFEKISKGVTEIYGSTEAGVIAYRQSCKDNLQFFNNVKFRQIKDEIYIKSSYFDEKELLLNDELEFFENQKFRIKKRNDRIAKIQEKRISLPEVEAKFLEHKFVENVYCLGINNKLCVAVILNNFGKNFLEKNGKLGLIKNLKNTQLSVNISPKKWRFLPTFPLNSRGKIDGKRIKEIFNTNVTFPDIVNFIFDKNFAELSLIFPKNCNFFDGHFPDFPILPGVAQLFFAKEFVRDIFNLNFVPQKVKKVKFSSIIKPEMKVKLRLERGENSVDYKFFDDEKVFSSGTFVL